jgi:hypothetical protein
MAISSTVKKTSTDAIQLEAKTGKKWKEAGDAIRAEYASAEAFTAIKDEYLDTVVYPALGDEAVRIMRAVIPRKNSKDFIGASATQQAEWLADGEAKISVRGTANSLFARVRDKYAFPSVADDTETESESEGANKRTDDVTYCMERNTQCEKRLQKSETPPKNIAKVLALYAEINKLLVG